MSYWDILTEDLQEYIINIRDEKLAKETFKKGDYWFNDTALGRIDVCICGSGDHWTFYANVQSSESNFAKLLSEDRTFA